MGKGKEKGIRFPLKTLLPRSCLQPFCSHSIGQNIVTWRHSAAKEAGKCSLCSRHRPSVLTFRSSVTEEEGKDEDWQNTSHLCISWKSPCKRFLAQSCKSSRFPRITMQKGVALRNSCGQVSTFFFGKLTWQHTRNLDTYRDMQYKMLLFTMYSKE